MITLKNRFRVIQPENKSHVFNKLDDCKNAIFLAGPCPRDGSKDEWREEAISILKKLKFKGCVINPTNPYYDETDKDHLEKQSKWEIEGMHKASAIVFWIERTEEHPAYTTNIEFGQWFDKPRVYCGWTNKALKNNYLQKRLDFIGKKRYKTLEEMLTQVVEDLDKSEPKKWWISDTHFSQERTLTLSKRPFRDLEEMDFTMISNWNKRITMQDEVYFLGDFGDSFDYLRSLNFKTMNFVLGNYERVYKDKDGTSKNIEAESRRKLSVYSNVKVYDRGECTVTLSDGTELMNIHEPVDPNGETDYLDKKCAYGHIHGRTIYKRNGADVGVDVNWFAPIDEEMLIWKLNAIQYLDQNVWMMDCK